MATLVSLFVAVHVSEAVPAAISGISFSAPPENSYKLGDVTISVSVSNFQLADKDGQPATAAEGHLLYSLDGNLPASEDSRAPGNTGSWAETASEIYTFHHVGSGTHIISVELVANDGKPLNPTTIATMTVVITELPHSSPAAVHIPLSFTSA